MTLARVAVLGIVIAIVYSLDFVALRWNASLEGFVWLLLMGFLQAAVLGYLLVRSTWRGWKLIAALFLVYAGITVFQTQIEAIVFLQYFQDIIPSSAMPALIINGIIAAALIALAAVFVFAKFQPAAATETASQPLHLSALQWIWKISALAVIYVFVYLLFGALVAKPLAGAAFDEYYANLQLPAWIIPFQVIRGAIWVLLTIPLIRMLRGSWREIGLGVALMLSVPIASLVIPPNEFMPPPIRWAHFVELFTSMFLFGWIDYWLLTWRLQPRPQRDLQGASHAA
jgi:hypothetical protein